MIRRCWTCGLSTTCGTVATAAQGTPAAPMRLSQVGASAVDNASTIAARSGSAFATRPSRVLNRGSSARSGRPMALHRIAYWPGVAAAISRKPSPVGKTSDVALPVWLRLP